MRASDHTRPTGQFRPNDRVIDPTGRQGTIIKSLGSYAGREYYRVSFAGVQITRSGRELRHDHKAPAMYRWPRKDGSE